MITGNTQILKRKKNLLPGKVNKPLISLQLVNNDGKLEEFDALLDPGSYSEAPYSLEVEADIVSYISSSLAKKIKNEFSSSVATCTCTCKPTKTCTPTGCFISTSCLTLTCKLKDDRVSADDIQIKFRIL